MYPLIQPGSLVLIDDTHRKIVNTGWANEYERPIYFFEHRKGLRVRLVYAAGESIGAAAASRLHVLSGDVQLSDGYRRSGPGGGCGYASGSGEATA